MTALMHFGLQSPRTRDLRSSAAARIKRGKPTVSSDAPVEGGCLGRYHHRHRLSTTMSPRTCLEPSLKQEWSGFANEPWQQDACSCLLQFSLLLKPVCRLATSCLLQSPGNPLHLHASVMRAELGDRLVESASRHGRFSLEGHLEHAVSAQRAPWLLTQDPETGQKALHAYP